MEGNPDIVSLEEKPLDSRWKPGPLPSTEDCGRSGLPSKDIASIAHYISAGVNLKMTSKAEYERDESLEMKSRISEDLIFRKADVQVLDCLADTPFEEINKNDVEASGWKQNVIFQVVSGIYECDGLVGMEDISANLTVITRSFKARGWVPS